MMVNGPKARTAFYQLNSRAGLSRTLFPNSSLGLLSPAEGSPSRCEHDTAGSDWLRGHS